MTILFIVLGSVVGLLALLFIIALFSKKEYAVQRHIVINRPSQEIFDYIKHIKNQDFFSKWVMTDPNMNKIFTGNDGEVGFIYAWDSVNKAAGKGEQEIKNIIDGKQLDIEVRFEKPMKAVGKTPFYCEAISENETKVIWGMTSAMNYPMNIMLLFINFDKILGKDIDTSLNNLKVILENK